MSEETKKSGEGGAVADTALLHQWIPVELKSRIDAYHAAFCEEMRGLIASPSYTDSVRRVIWVGLERLEREIAERQAAEREARAP